MSSKPSLTKGQRAYEARRAEKAGMSLDKWLAEKQKLATAAARDEERARKAAEAKAAKPTGFLSRLLERAHKPL